MLWQSIGNLKKYDYLKARFEIGYDFLRRNDLAEMAEGVVQLEQGVRVQIQHYTTVCTEDARFETHDRYFDIQYIIEGQEYFGVAARKGLQSEAEYDVERDITFYHPPAESGVILLQAGDFAMVSPEEAHRPRCRVGKESFVKKIVLKVPVSYDKVDL